MDSFHLDQQSNVGQFCVRPRSLELTDRLRRAQPEAGRMVRGIEAEVANQNLLTSRLLLGSPR